MRPERTSSIPGWYSPRQASAKASQSRLYPSGLRTRSASRATEVRQSTRRAEDVEEEGFDVGDGGF